MVGHRIESIPNHPRHELGSVHGLHDQLFFGAHLLQYVKNWNDLQKLFHYSKIMKKADACYEVSLRALPVQVCLLTRFEFALISPLGF